MKKLQFIIIAELIIILCLTAFLFSEYRNRQHSKELFINDVYFLLTDISNNLDNIENVNAFSFTAYMNLTRLDAVCQIHNQETSGTFHYNSPGIFGEIVDSIYNNEYDKDELEMMASDIQRMVQDLSDNSGIAENPDLSYDEINDIIDPFYNRWGN